MAGAVSERIGLGHCNHNIDQIINPQNLKEIERQKELLKDVFLLPQYTSDARKVSILMGLSAIVTEICERRGSIDDFKEFQNTVIDLPDYAFLREPYPGLNVTGWSIFFAMIDPLTYGAKIHRVVEQRGTSGKR